MTTETLARVKWLFNTGRVKAAAADSTRRRRTGITPILRGLLRAASPHSLNRNQSACMKLKHCAHAFCGGLWRDYSHSGDETRFTHRKCASYFPAQCFSFEAIKHHSKLCALVEKLWKLISDK